jgi:gamma-glutamyltranspeptidase/glutathione hydrolase
MEMLAAGGNAVDAAVTAALVASVVAPFHCGPGGYGGSMIVATADGHTIAGIDYNTVAPASLPSAPGSITQIGWKSVGVPGIPAGMQRALDRYGTKSFAEVVAPAIRYARDGFPVTAQIVRSIREMQKRIAADLGSAKLLLPGGEPPKLGSAFKNPELATMLETLAKRGSVESFYKGDIAAKIAAAIQAGGGYVTAADMAAYEARDVKPVSLSWNNWAIHTPPPTAGGATALEALGVLKVLKWNEWDQELPKFLTACVESLRLAWEDRLRFFADPTKVDVPLDRLLGDAHAQELASKVLKALRDNKPNPAWTDNRPANGTQHLSAVDRNGMMVALTLTHGGYFGAQVTVDGLGLTLGHGLSRFDREPGRANSAAPGKRPLHNMSPTVVFKDGRLTMALGGRGGRKIPNAVFEVLAQYVALGKAPKQAITAPRIHTEGGLKVDLEKEWPESAAAGLQAAGYTVARATSAVVSAVWRDPITRAVGGATR